MSLFHPRVVNKHIDHVPAITQQHAATLAKWSENLEKGIYDSETQNDGEFIQRILIDVLGYKGSSNGEHWTVAKNQPIGKGNVDVALGNFSLGKAEILAPLELKGARTRDLDAIMPGRNKSPVKQAWEYAIDGKGTQWVLVSNYREIRLYAFGSGTKDYESFDLSKLTNPKEYSRFILILSADNLLSGFTASLLQDSEKQEKEITEELYEDYKALRANMVHEIGKTNPNKSPIDIIRFTQTILDRVLFIAFAEDKSLLPEKTLQKAFDTVNPYNPQPIWDNFKGLFQAIDKGNSVLKIPGYNGGLFKQNPEIDGLKISNDICYGFKKMGDYRFDSDVSVDILGHIFEQSISDIEELKEFAEGNGPKYDTKNGRRKKDGIFYTPPHITRSIVEECVGGWLADKRKEIGFFNLPELTDSDFESIKITGKRKIRHEHNRNIAEHIVAWTAYKEVLSNIKVLDPACGSGAFLNEVFDYLKREGQTVNNELARLTSGQIELFRWDTHILANNIYGVDLNHESIELTKLSLWLKTANRNEKLTYLDHNIKVGNSLIDDIAVGGGQAFNWHDSFSSVLSTGGFDVIVGNPPYGAYLNPSEIEYLEKVYESFEYQANTYVIFYEKGISLLKDCGYLGYITPATFLYQHYFKNIRKMIAKYDVRTVTKYTYPVFPDADTGDTATLVLRKSEQFNDEVVVQVSSAKSDFVGGRTVLNREAFFNRDGTFRVSESKIPDKVYCHPVLGDIAHIVVGVKAYQTGKGSPKQTKETVSAKPFTSFKPEAAPYRACVVGSDFHRYRFIEEPKMFLRYGEWLAEPRTDAPFSEEKIIIRQTADSIIAHIDSSKSINLNNVYNVGRIKEGYSLKYILGLLNSRLIKYIYQDISQEKGKLFAEVKKVYLSRIPIVTPEPSCRLIVENAVDRVIELNKDIKRIKDGFEILAASEFDVDVEILKKSLAGNFKSFCGIVEKAIKPNRMSLQEKSEWLNYFDNVSQSLQALEVEIAEKEREIDDLVYGLYDLTADEIQALEAS